MYDMKYSLMTEAASILAENESRRAMEQARTMLEDVESPVTKKFHEKLFSMVIDKKHIDFDDIPESKGMITNYKGYQPMMDTLSTMEEFAGAQKASDVLSSIEIVRNAITNITKLSLQYTVGFQKKNDYVMMEYNTLVATCVEATTSLLYEFIDYMKRPDMGLQEIQLKNTKTRPDLFYIEQLKKFNRVVEHERYSEYLKQLLNGGKENFTGYTAIGMAAFGLIASMVVPTIRELVYQFYHMRAKISESCDLQATFLEMNKARLEADDTVNPSKKAKIVKRQENARKKFLKLADKLRVNGVQARKTTKQELSSKDELITINTLRDEVDNSPLDLL